MCSLPCVWSVDITICNVPIIMNKICSWTVSCKTIDLILRLSFRLTDLLRVNDFAVICFDEESKYIEVCTRTHVSGERGVCVSTMRVLPSVVTRTLWTQLSSVYRQ